MKSLKLIVVAAKYALRNRTRSILTIVGVATGMFLFTTIETMQDSLKSATSITANDTTLIVFRENRFVHPQANFLNTMKMKLRKLTELRM